jgi:hypothetical protein
MATTLHSQLKLHYVRNTERHEVTVGSFRIDAIDRWNRLIEIQCAPLSSIRQKVGELCKSHRVLVVKPFSARKKIIRMASADGPVSSIRSSPQRSTVLRVFEELVHFCDVFPHPKLLVDVLLTEQTEIRIPSNKQRSRYQVLDRTLISVISRTRLSSSDDLWHLLDADVPERFSTADLALAAKIPRWLAQKAVYCFRRMNFLEVCGRHGNSVIYQKIGYQKIGGSRSSASRSSHRAA